MILLVLQTFEVIQLVCVNVLKNYHYHKRSNIELKLCENTHMRSEIRQIRQKCCKIEFAGEEMNGRVLSLYF